MDWSFSDVNSSISINPQKPPEATKCQMPTIGPMVPDVSLVFGGGAAELENIYQHTDVLKTTARATQFGTHTNGGSKIDNGKAFKSSSTGRQNVHRVPNESELTNIKDWYIPNKYGLHLNQGFDRYLREIENSKISSSAVPKSMEFSDSIVYQWGSKDTAASKTENVQHKLDTKTKSKCDFARDFKVPIDKEIIESEIDEICKFSQTLEELCKESDILKSGSKINKHVIESEIDHICKVSDTLKKLYEESDIPLARSVTDQNVFKHSEQLNGSYPKSISPQERLIDSWKENEPIPAPRTVKLKLEPDFIETETTKVSNNYDQFNGLEYDRNEDASKNTFNEVGDHLKIGDSDYLRYSKTLTVNTQSSPKSVYSVNKYTTIQSPTCIMRTQSTMDNGNFKQQNDSYTHHINKDASERNKTRKYNLSDTIDELCKETEILNPGSKMSRGMNYSPTVNTNTRSTPNSAEFKANEQTKISQNSQPFKSESNITSDIYGIDNVENGTEVSKALERLCDESEKQTNLLKTIAESLHFFNTQQGLLFSNLFKKLDAVLDVANHRNLRTPHKVDAETLTSPEKVDAETLTSPPIESKQEIIPDNKVDEEQPDKTDSNSEKARAPIKYASADQVTEEVMDSQPIIKNPSQKKDSVDHRQPKTEESQFLGTDSIHLSEINVPTPAFNQPTPVSSIHVDIQDYEEFTDGDDDDRIDCHSNACQNGNSLISCDGRQEIFYRKVVGQVSKLLKGSSSFKRDSTYRCTEVKKSEKMTLSGKEIVKRATIRQQQLLGINVQERSVIEETILVPAECNSLGNKFGTRLNELAGKYLKSQEHSQMFPSHTNISMSTRQYLERYQILPGTDSEYGN